jgi:hypothetical protein
MFLFVGDLIMAGNETISIHYRYAVGVLDPGVEVSGIERQPFGPEGPQGCPPPVAVASVLGVIHPVADIHCLVHSHLRVNRVASDSQVIRTVHIGSPELNL